MEIRKAKIDDLRKIQELNLILCKDEERAYNYGTDLNWTFSKDGENYFKEKIIGKTSITFVAIKDKEIVGYLSGGLTKSEAYRSVSQISEIETMFVLEEFRSLGVGKMLYEKFKEWSKGEGVGIIRVEATAQNKKGINFYKKMGLNDYTLILEGRI